MVQHSQSALSSRGNSPLRKALAAILRIRGINLLLGATPMLFLLFGAVTFWAAQKQDQAEARTRRAYRVLLALQRTDGRLLECVAGLRLYLQIPEAKTLHGYTAARQALEFEMDAAEALSRDEPAAQERLSRARALAGQWSASADLAIAGVRRDPPAGLAVARRRLGERLSLIESARQELTTGVAAMRGVLQAREESDARTRMGFIVALAGVLVAGLAVGGVVLALVARLEDHARALHAENAQRTQAEARANKLVELSPHPLVIVDQDRRIVQVNSEALRIFGYTREEVVGEPVELLVPHRYREHHPALAGGYFKAPAIRPMGTGRDLFALRKDGTEFPVDISLGPLEVEGGLHVIASIVDMTDRAREQAALKAANQAFETVNRELDSFAYSVAHDLRAPLRSVTGFAELLLNKHRSGLGEEAQDYLARIRQAGNRMALLIDDLLTLSRITRSDLNRAPVNLTAIAHTVLEELRASDPDRRVDIDVQEGLAGSADPRLLKVLLDNLLGNAWKFTSRIPQPHIEFGTLLSSSEVVYFVRDNGAGFDMTYAHKLFRPFERLHDGREFSGTGVGLATAHRIVSRHGGRIWAESQVGRGATFYFTL